MKTVRFGIIGCGLMGREFASAAARWCHILEPIAKPEIVAVCDPDPKQLDWFTTRVPSVSLASPHYRELLGRSDVEAVYVAIPHHLHREVYCAVIESGKHLMGEKPFGIDQAANRAILECLEKNPQIFSRCSSESPFFPAMQKLCGLIEQNRLGQILEANTGFLHSSDLDPNKPINWKRMVRFNGEYGVLGDLGMHALHVPLRAGWEVRNVRAILSNVVKARPDANRQLVPCDTWDNGVLFMETTSPSSGEPFPWTVKLQRIAPGHRNTWYTEILGTQGSVRWSSENPQLLQVMTYVPGQPQAWQQLQVGNEPAFKTLTGSIFEFGFSDSILQMWAAFLYELVEKKPLHRFAGCVNPQETAKSHQIFTAALKSQEVSQTIQL